MARGSSWGNSAEDSVVSMRGGSGGYRLGFRLCLDQDCNDYDPEINPGAGEICWDGIDNDCDLVIDEQDCVGGNNVLYLDEMEGIHSNMVSIPGGTFEMGRAYEVRLESGPNEDPPHMVTLSSFKISAYEVTQSQWKAVMGENPSYFYTNYGDSPVENVSWNGVQDFIDELNRQTGENYRLPTEAEWEYAARAGTTTNLYCGDDHSCLEDIAWYVAGQEGRTTAGPQPVGLKQPNAWGLYDMIGNVSEHVSDWYDDDYYDVSPLSDPQGPDSGDYKVVRGGFWNGPGNTYPFSVTIRYGVAPDSGPQQFSQLYPDYGFRLALP
jgi:formylglycine-generating enzyme required for sulfatase activity